MILSNSSVCDVLACVAPRGECKLAVEANLTGVDPLASFCECKEGYTYMRADVADRSHCDIPSHTEDVFRVICSLLLLFLSMLNFRSLLKSPQRNRFGRRILMEKAFGGFFGFMFFVFHGVEDGIGHASLVCFCLWQCIMVFGGTAVILLLAEQLKYHAQLARDNRRQYNGLLRIENICRFSGMFYALPLCVGLIAHVVWKEQKVWDMANRASTMFYVGALVWASVWSYWFTELARRLTIIMEVEVNSNQKNESIKTALFNQLGFLRWSMFVLSFTCFGPMIFLIMHEFSAATWRFRWIIWWICVFAIILAQYVVYIFVEYHAILSVRTSQKLQATSSPRRETVRMTVAGRSLTMA